MDKVGAMHDCITDRVPRQHKDAANGQFQLERGFLTEECFLEERWAQFIYRNKMNHDDYWESIKWLLEYTEEYAGHGRKAAEHGKDSHATFTSDDGLKTATSELRTLLQGRTALRGNFGVVASYQPRFE